SRRRSYQGERKFGDGYAGHAEDEGGHAGAQHAGVAREPPSHQAQYEERRRHRCRRGGEQLGRCHRVVAGQGHVGQGEPAQTGGDGQQRGGGDGVGHTQPGGGPTVTGIGVTVPSPPAAGRGWRRGDGRGGLGRRDQDVRFGPHAPLTPLDDTAKGTDVLDRLSPTAIERGDNRSMSMPRVPNQPVSVVLLHGQPGTAAVWARVRALLPPDLPVVAPDRPGYGSNPAPAMGLADNADQVAAALRSTGGANIVVGHSWAGGVALGLARLDAPVMMLAGERDHLVPLDTARALASGIPSAQLRILAGVGHDLPLEAPEAVASAIVELVSQVRTVGGDGAGPASAP